MKNKLREFWNNITWDAKTVGLAAGLISQLALLMILLVYKIDFLETIMVIIWLSGIAVLCITQGRYIFRGVLGWCKKLFFFGWLVVPFPMDIFTGLACSGLAIGLGNFMIFFLPGVLSVSSYMKAKKEGR